MAKTAQKITPTSELNVDSLYANSRISNVNKTYQVANTNSVPNINRSPDPRFRVEKKYQTANDNRPPSKDTRKVNNNPTGKITNEKRVANQRNNKVGIVRNLVRVNPAVNLILQNRRERLTVSLTEEGVDKAKVKSRARWLLAIGWIVSFPVAIFNGLFIYLFNAWNEVQDGGLWDIAKSAVTLNLDEAVIKTGYYFNSDMLMAFMVTCWAIGFTLAAAFLFVAVKVLAGAGAETKNTSVKEGLVLVDLVAAFIPMANVWPWTNSLIKHVSKHPE